MAYSSVNAMLNVSRQNNQPLWDVILQSDLLESGLTRPQSLAEMHHLWQVMVQTSDNYCGADRSASGFAGGDAAKVAEAEARGQLLTGGYLAQVMAEALKTAECNACMKRIVAAPTAGSCGVLPAVLLPLWRSGSYNEEAICRALYVSAGFGQVVAARATLAGAEGGCQAEVGTASAMAAASSVYLMGGSPEQSFAAAGLAIQNMLGLVCDPIAGLVEAPCQARNAAGASNALVSAELVLAGVPEVIPFDEVVEAARQVGHALPESLRETALGGIAATPTACRLAVQVGDRLRGLPRVRLNIFLRLTRAYTLFDGEKSFGSFAWQKCCPRKCGIYVRKNRICSCRVLGTFV